MTSTVSPKPGPLAGRVALVAGATRGAGRAIAVELARAGAFVYATGRSSRFDSIDSRVGMLRRHQATLLWNMLASVAGFSRGRA